MLEQILAVFLLKGCDDRGKGVVIHIAVGEKHLKRPGFRNILVVVVARFFICVIRKSVVEAALALFVVSIAEASLALPDAVAALPAQAIRTDFYEVSLVELANFLGSGCYKLDLEQGIELFHKLIGLLNYGLLSGQIQVDLFQFLKAGEELQRLEISEIVVAEVDLKVLDIRNISIVAFDLLHERR